jgi:hypothetical protein
MGHIYIVIISKRAWWANAVEKNLSAATVIHEISGEIQNPGSIEKEFAGQVPAAGCGNYIVANARRLFPARAPRSACRRRQTVAG